MNIDITYDFAEGYEEYEDYDKSPVVIKVCHCEQCRGVRDKRKNRVLKKRIKRLYNKKRRNWKHNGKIIYHYWA